MSIYNFERLKMTILSHYYKYIKGSKKVGDKILILIFVSNVSRITTVRRTKHMNEKKLMYSLILNRCIPAVLSVKLEFYGYRCIPGVILSII